MEATVDTRELETKVKDMYRHVAEQPEGTYHFELGRPLAERLGYPAELLDRVPPGAVESFAGVGYFFDLAGLADGESVIDLGSGSGMDVFCAADLWASCIGGAAQQDAYRTAIEGAGMRIEEIRENPYEFISDRARDASKKYGVKSVSILAVKA